MGTDAHDHWRRILSVGGTTTFPRFSRERERGTATLELDLGDALVARIRELATHQGVPAGAALLAAHARVLAALSGERDVVTGLAGHPVRLDTDRPDWAALIAAAGRTLAGSATHGDADVAAIARELGVDPQPDETALGEVEPDTANGKIDHKALTADATALLSVVTDVGLPPKTDNERRVAAAFATVLGLDPDDIMRDDSFFDRGGTSLSAVKLVIALKRAVALKDVVRTPVLSDLAAVLDGVPSS